SNETRLVKFEVDADVRRDNVPEARQVALHFIDHGEGRGIGALRHRDVNGSAPVHQRVPRQNIRAVLYRPDVPKEDRRARARPQGNVLELLNARDHGVDGSHSHELAGAHIAGRQNGVARADGFDHVFWGEVVGPQAVRIDVDHNGALVASEGWGSGHTGQSGKQRADPVQSLVLNLTHTPRVTRKNQITDWDTTRVEPHDERRDRSVRHKGVGAIDIGNCLGERLAHVGARMKGQLEETDILDGFRLDTFDAGNVEEVI